MQIKPSESHTLVLEDDENLDAVMNQKLIDQGDRDVGEK